ncbi:MAG: histidine kinase dimerization/phosphoacceptor domain -containing protein [Ginsengibacter sp.]
MKKLVIILLMLSFCGASFAQDISRHEVDSLISALKRSKADTARINLLLTLAKFQIFKPGEYQQDLDSAVVFIEKAKALNARLKSNKSLEFITLTGAFLIKERGQTELSKKMVEQVIIMINAEKDKSYLADAYFALSDYYDYNDPKQLSEKINLVEKAVTGFQQSGNKERQGLSLKVLADLYINQGKYSVALEKLNLSLEAYNSIHYTQLQGVYVLYGSIYINNGNYKQALVYELMALDYAEKNKDTSMNLCQINNYIGIVFYQLGEKEKAVNYYETALQIAEKNNDNDNVLVMIANLVDNYTGMGAPEKGLRLLYTTPKKFLVPKHDQSDYMIPQAYFSIYYFLNDYKKAGFYADKLINTINEHKPDYANLGGIYYTVANYYISTRQFIKARNLLKKNDLLTYNTVDPFRANQMDYLRFLLDKASGNYKSAVERLLKYNMVKDSLFNETKSKQIKELEIAYETQKKEDSLKIKDKNITVLNQQHQMQQGYLDRANLLRNVTFGGILLLFVIMGLLYRQYCNKQRTNQMIMHKNELLEHLVSEKEWLLKEVHHRVKNNLQTVVSLLELQSENLSDDALSAIHDSQNRIYAMSLIHQKLYQTDNIASINMQPYLLELMNHLRAIYNPERTINFDLQVAPIELDVSQAIPVGLIVNEAVTNSMKYAFNYPASNHEIAIVLAQNKKHAVKLIIADNGSGLTPGFINADANGLGFKLMNALAGDIEGKLTVESKEGTVIKVIFNASITFDERAEIPEPEKAYSI